MGQPAIDEDQVDIEILTDWAALSEPRRQALQAGCEAMEVDRAAENHTQAAS